MSEKSRVIRVFLSSTFRDFAEERDLLVRKVFPELRRLCRERQVELVEVDLRWGITEEEAQQGKVLPICLGEIDRARPYFMGFIGDRYGWVPEGSQYPEAIVEREPWLQEHAGGKSVTELEMLHGVLNNPAMDGRAFFYFRDSNYSQAKGGDYRSEDAASAAKLEALKDRIRSSGFPVMEDYPNPQALADQVRADLLALIESEYPIDEVPDALTLERMKHAAYSKARCGLYIGGEQYFAQLDAALSAEAAEPVLISSEAGLGKSALIAKWLHRWRAQHPHIPIILHHLSASAEADDPTHLVRRLGEEAAVITGQPFEVGKSRDEILEQMPTILANLSSHAEREAVSVLLVLDGLERCGTEFEDLRWFPRHLPSHIRIVASCSEGPAKEHLQNLPLDWLLIDLESLSEQQGRDFIERYLITYRKSLTPAQADCILAHPLSGRPLWLITLLEELRLFGVHEELEARLDTLLSNRPGKAAGEASTIDDLYEHVLARIEEDIDEDYEVAAFKALWASYDGLARSELLELTGMPPAKWAEIQNALDENLFESGGQITFANDYIRKAVEDRHLPTEADKVTAHRWLGEWFEGREVTLDVAQERVHQWRQAGDTGRLRACLLEQSVFEQIFWHNQYTLLEYWADLDVDIEARYKEVFGLWQNRDVVALPLAKFLMQCGCLGIFVENLYECALTEQTKIHGENHALTRVVRYYFGIFLLNKRSLGKAAILLSKLLEYEGEMLGAKHVDTASTLVVHAELLGASGDFVGAEDLFLRGLKTLKNVKGSEHLDTLSCAFNYGRLLRKKGDLDRAEELFRQVLEGEELKLGSKHQRTLDSLSALGNLLFQKNELIESESLLRRALSGRKEALGLEHHQTLKSFDDLRALLHAKEDCEGAESLYWEAKALPDMKSPF